MPNPSNVALFSAGQVPQHVLDARASGSSLNLNANASVGLSSGFPVLSLAGKEWSIKFRGTPEVQPTREMHVVVVGMPAGLSKVYYEKGYSQGDKDPPDCFSMNGIEPDPSSPKRQSNLCVTCFQNRFGSRPSNTPGGRPGKACSDGRRLALILYDNPECLKYDSPLLLRVPQKSTVTLDNYCRELAAGGADITQVITTLSFSSAVTYPLVEFRAAGWVPDDVFAWVEHWARSDMVDRMLNDAMMLQGDDQAQSVQPAPTLLQTPRPAAPAPQQASPFATSQQAPRPGNGATQPPAPAQAAPPPPPAPAPPPAQAAPPPPAASRPRGRPPGSRNKVDAPPQAAPTPASAPVQAAPPPAPVAQAAPAPAQAAPAPEEPEEATTPMAVIQGAPKNMVNIIDGLLD